VSDEQPAESIDRGDLDKARLYLGESDFYMDQYRTNLGDVAAVTIASAEKAASNEDSAAIIPVNDQFVVLIVADGVGGLAGARRASNITIKTIHNALRRIDDTSDKKIRTAILDGIEAANRAVLDLGTRSASTLALAEIGPDYVRTYHVGDSIVLMCGQRGHIKLQTIPHSPVGFAMEAGLIDETEALQHSELNLIFNVIGSSDMRIEIGSELPIAPRDTILLASDGLTDNVMQDETISAIRKGTMADSVRKLTDLTIARMTEQKPGQPSKPDDYTAILYRPLLTRRSKSKNRR
jgi:serine/threonine protein phosphatase PrpC